MISNEIVQGIGLNIASSAIYDFLKLFFSKKPDADVLELKKGLASFLSIEGADIKADKLIQILAKNGDIVIQDTRLFASDSITMASSHGTKFTFGDGSTSETNKTKIDAGRGAFIQGTGGAKVVQNEDGSISFFT